MWKQSDTQTGTKTNMATGRKETLILMHVHILYVYYLGLNHNRGKVYLQYMCIHKYARL